MNHNIHNTVFSKKNHKTFKRNITFLILPSFFSPSKIHYNIKSHNLNSLQLIQPIIMINSHAIVMYHKHVINAGYLLKYIINNENIKFPKYFGIYLLIFR